MLVSFGATPFGYYWWSMVLDFTSAAAHACDILFRLIFFIFIDFFVLFADLGFVLPLVFFCIINKILHHLVLWFSDILLYL